MRKNWFGMLLVLGISLAPLYGASADSSDSAPCASEISVRKDWFKLTGDMAAIHGAMPNGICPEVKQVIAAVTAEIPAVSVSTEASVEAVNSAVVAEVSSETVKLSYYFTVETPALQKAGQIKLAALRFRLEYQANKLEEAISRMADDEVVTDYELGVLEGAIRSYDRLRFSANEKLAFYRLEIPEDERVEAYRKLTVISDGQFLSVDDKNESIRRFFTNLTGKDVRVRIGAVGRWYMTGWGTAVAIILLVAAL